ncbi:MAG TPA: ABC transporter ATP-binding protein, partial [Acidimicrobiales bacterium]
MSMGPMGALRGPMGAQRKSKDLRATVRRLAGRMRTERTKLILAFMLGVTSVTFMVLGPKILGSATNVLFNGIVGKRLPTGVTKAQAIAMLRAEGHNQIAAMISGMNVTPGVGVNVTRLGEILAVAALLYVLGAAFTYFQGFTMAGLTQRMMSDMRRDVESKLSRLPLRYFDSHPHGDVLSRVTNDIDNLTTSIQQGLSQLLTSVLTIVGVLGMMIWISPLLALVSVITIPAAMVVTFFIAKRSQVQFTAQWSQTGALNGLVEETHTGHELVQVFGRSDATVEEFSRRNRLLYVASFRAQFLSGVIQPTMQFIANINYVVIAVLGGYRVASGLLSLGAVTAFIQYSRQFTMPLTQIASQMNMLQSGLASAERVFELLDAEEEEPETARDGAETAHGPGSVRLDNVRFRYESDEPLIEGFNLDVAPGQTIAIVGPTGAGKTTMVKLLMRFYDVNSGAILVDGHNIRDYTRGDLRCTFGMVLQDTWLYNGTIMENIRYGRSDATDQEVIEASK